MVQFGAAYDECVPAEHFLHTTAPSTEYMPDEQLLQVEEPEPSAYEPALHTVHMLAPLDDDLPAGHNVHIPLAPEEPYKHTNLYKLSMAIVSDQ